MTKKERLKFFICFCIVMSEGRFMNNYHTHTTRCHHAIGKEEEYIQAAIQSGIKELGFSDHTPWHYDVDYHPTMRMEESQLDDYISMLKQLREKYKKQISIKIGLECEYFPAYMPWLKKILKEKEIDYIILGNHFKENDAFGIYFGNVVDKEDVTCYVDSCIEAMQTGLYSYLAHPDLIHYPHNDEFYRKEIERLCLAAKKYCIPLEFNLLGYQTRRHYPNPAFWQIASKVQNEAIIGFDAHQPDSLLDQKSYQEAVAYLNSLSLTIIDTISFLK